MELIESYIDSLAINKSSIQNGWGLIKKKKFIKLCISKEDDLLFGECKGSGASNYIVSADFINKDNPVFRCNCPSRQFPCKHALGIMYAYISKDTFNIEEIPEDIQSKRDKIVKKAENKKNAEPKKVNLNALSKKLDIQIDGLKLVQNLINQTLKFGIGSFDKKTSDLFENMATQMGDHYLIGIQSYIREIILISNLTDKEIVYSKMFIKLTKLHSLCEKSILYLESRKNDISLKRSVDNNIEETIGDSWKIEELQEYNLFKENIELVQLSFNSSFEQSSSMYIDTGYWYDLNDGTIYKSQNYRPLKALKYIKEDDSFFDIIIFKKMYIHPNLINNRIRWNEFSARKIESSDYKKISSFKSKSLQQIIKEAKDLMKNIINEPNPVYLINFKNIGSNGNSYILEDVNGDMIELYNSNDYDLNILKYIDKNYKQNGIALIQFNFDIINNKINTKLLSIINNSNIIRIQY